MTLSQITYELLSWLAVVAVIAIVAVIALSIALRLIEKHYRRKDDE